MAKTSIGLYCYDCDLDFTVKFSEEQTKVEPVFCPFCGAEIDAEDGDTETPGDEELEDRWS